VKRIDYALALAFGAMLALSFVFGLRLLAASLP
jgi:hypothetical protein